MFVIQEIIYVKENVFPAALGRDKAVSLDLIETNNLASSHSSHEPTPTQSSFNPFVNAGSHR